MFLQSLVFGYGGLRFNDNGISMDPLLPPGVTAMKLRGLNYADAVRQQSLLWKLVVTTAIICHDRLGTNMRKPKRTTVLNLMKEFDVEISREGSRFVRRVLEGDSGNVALHRAPDGVYWLR